MSENKIQMITIDRLYPHPDNPRKELGDLTELTESIKESGVFQNLTVVPHEELDGEYTVIIGHRRLEAAKRAGLTALPCMITEMDQKEQLATMLLENMQRCDLTIIEQAQGIQMMIDLGESVEQISQKTGLSKSTIYKRKNIAELDREETKKALERGATLMDFVELEKIKDPETKNQVLQNMGTKDFTWKLKGALEKEKILENEPKIRAVLETFATEEKLDYEQFRYTFMESISKSSDPENISIPEEYEDGEYVFDNNERVFYLYKKSIKIQEKNEDDQKREQRIKRRGELASLISKSYDLRKEYILGLSNNNIRKKTKEIQAFLGMALLTEHRNWNLKRDFQKLSEINLDFKSSDDSIEKLNQMRQELEYNSDRNLMIITFLLLDSKDHNNHTWHAEFVKNEYFEIAYQFAEMLGYECSQEEMQLRDGTHELYWKEEEDEGN